MHHVAFYEPHYDEATLALWKIRGGYKYGSILGDLHRRARISVLMRKTPPPDDLHRLNLEKNHGVSFVELDLAGDESPEEMAGVLEKTLAELKVSIASNLNGRGIDYNFALALAASRMGIRYVYRIAGNDIESRAKVTESRYRPFYGSGVQFELIKHERLAVHMASAVVVMSEREKRRVGALAVSDDNIHVSVRGVDHAHFRPAETPSDQCRRFLFVGRQSYEKGYDILEAATRILEARGEDVTVSFAGTFEPSVDGIRNYLGFFEYDRLPALYREHDALVLCSRSEGFPQVIMEAMSCGLPCITTRRLFEFDLSDGVDTMLIDDNPESVAEGISRMRRDPAIFARLREGSKATAKAFFNEEMNRRRYFDILLDAA